MLILRDNEQSFCSDFVPLEDIYQHKMMRATSHWPYFSKLVLQYHVALCYLVHQLQKQRNYKKM